MANPKDDDQATRPIREVHPKSPGPSEQGLGRETRIILPDRGTGSTDDAAGKAADRGGAGAGDSGRTILHSPRQSAESDAQETAQSPGTRQEYVTGWLVAIAGPGKGIATPIFEGQNSVGRDQWERVPLNFGDDTISSRGHFFVTYEPKERTFYIHKGTSTNLVYLNDKVVIDAKPLVDGNVIEVGKTKLRFVPLCGPAFSWDDA